MAEGKIEQAKKDAESLIAPIVSVFHTSLFEVYMKGFLDGLKSSEPLEEDAECIFTEEGQSLVKLKKDAILQKKLKPEEFSVRVWNVLKAMDVYTLSDMIGYTQMDYIRQRNFGRVCLAEVIDYAHKYGYEIKTK